VAYPGIGQQGYGQDYGYLFPQQQPTFRPSQVPQTPQVSQASQASQRKQSWPARHKALTSLFIFVGLIIIIVAANSGGSPSSSGGGTANGTQPGSPAPAATAVPKTNQAAATQTITYEVTGSSADVTYGPAGSTLSGTVPMKITAKLGDPIYYSLQAQLQGAGSVTVKILINGIVISQGTASGGYNIATAEISQDPFSGQWTDTNNG